MADQPDHATLLRHWADVAPMGGECAVVMRAAAEEIEQLRAELDEAELKYLAERGENERLRAEVQKTLDAGAVWDRAYCELRQEHDHWQVVLEAIRDACSDGHGKRNPKYGLAWQLADEALRPAN